MKNIAAFRPDFALMTALMAVLILALALPSGAQALTRSERVIVHYQKNMSFKMKREKALARDILAQRPDTISLQEVNRDNHKIFNMLAGEYPSRHFCKFPDIGGVAVLSRWPLVAGTERCLRGQGVAAMQVQMPEGRVWVMSIHMETPDKPLHDVMVERLPPEISGMAGPKIIGGDFNAVPTSKAVSGFARRIGLDRIGRSITTYRVNGVLGVPIDHVMATGGQGEVIQLPFIGSDHYGVLARFTMQF